MTCPHCNRAAPDDARFCPYCAGALLPADQRECPDCGEEIGPRDKVCTFCGSRVRVEEPPQPQQPIRPPSGPGAPAVLVVAAVAVLVFAALVGVALFLISAGPARSPVPQPVKPVPVGTSPSIQKRLQPGMIWDYMVSNVAPGTTVTGSTNGPSVDMCIVPVGTWKSARTREQQNSIINEALRSGDGVTGAAFSMRVGAEHSVVVVVIRYRSASSAPEAVVSISVERR